MNPTRKSDVKNHLSARGRAGSGTFLAANRLETPGFSEAEAAELRNDPTGFAEDFIGEHVGRRHSCAGVTGKLGTMIPHVMFLRETCALPDRFDLRQERFCDRWMQVDGLTACALDAKVRRAGWHFMWMVGSCCRRGLGWTEDRAVRQAVGRALHNTSEQLNAAELDSVVVKKYPGFFLAKATLHPRQIQQSASLDTPNA